MRASQTALSFPGHALAVAFTRRLHVDLDVALTTAEVWAHPSPAELAVHIDSSLDTPVGNG